ncbi:MAG: HAD-IC family P-type ATPase [Burkholderiaceae bacterium]|jgi:magnesium-transporting ATPase (P-type)|nr:HAD-IC family P-type ATPase [Burkholderiaceae bacterium]
MPDLPFTFNLPEPPHTLTPERVAALLQSDARHGLDEGEAARRLAACGPNALPEAAKRGWLVRFGAQFANALIAFLLAAAVVALLLGHWVDAAVIVGVVLVNAVMGVLQEGKAEAAMAALRQMLTPHARVLRPGGPQVADVAALVPGDVVLIEAGDRVPADLRLTQARALRIDEALLTGESVVAEKSTAPAAADAPLGERGGMAYSGTLVAAGSGLGVVVATGARTEIGKISLMLGAITDLSTPLLRQIDRFGRQLTAGAFTVAALLYVFAVAVRGYSWLDALMTVVALAVSFVPEGLPAVMTITLAIGVQRMAARHAIVRRLPAVETLGATSIICSDKTGTLTRNEMTCRQLLTAGSQATASGAGYEPIGHVRQEDGAKPGPDMRRLALIGLLCNDAALAESEGQWLVHGDPMEGALLALAVKAGLTPQDEVDRHPRLDTVPFDAAHRYMATLHAIPEPAGEPESGALLMVKGAPERLLAMCAHALAADGRAVCALDTADWQAHIERIAAGGQRVLGFAFKRLPEKPAQIAPAHLEGLTLAGLIGFIDPPRPEAVTAVADCRSAGVAVKMITGDHAATARAIAVQLGLAPKPFVATGADVDATSDADLPALAQRTHVFARTSPEHKLRVVRALQSQGAVVAMTGDGVNDAPSLKQADVGIAMGRKGTEAAKEAAQVVLADDNFASIVAAVHEGRVVYDNIRKVLAWTLPTNGGEVLAVAAALLLGLTLPLTPAQILWINMALTITLGLALAFEPPEGGVMRRPPRPAHAPLMSPFMLWRLALVSTLFALAVYAVVGWGHWRQLPLEATRTLVVNTFCALEIGYLFSVRYLHASSLTWQAMRGTPAVLYAVLGVLALQLAFTYTPWMQLLFATRSLALPDLLLAPALGALLLFALEAEKTLLRKLGWFDELKG